MTFVLLLAPHTQAHNTYNFICDFILISFHFNYIFRSINYNRQVIFIINRLISSYTASPQFSKFLILCFISENRGLC